ncbi:MAG: hypothetical protein RMA76_10340 [Deltaproteobacteria bacterium]|jgi:hypothetical protein
MNTLPSFPVDLHTHERRRLRAEDAERMIRRFVWQRRLTRGLVFATSVAVVALGIVAIAERGSHVAAQVDAALQVGEPLADVPAVSPLLDGEGFGLEPDAAAIPVGVAEDEAPAERGDAVEAPEQAPEIAEPVPDSRSSTSEHVAPVGLTAAPVTGAPDPQAAPVKAGPGERAAPKRVAAADQEAASVTAPSGSRAAPKRVAAAGPDAASSMVPSGSRAAPKRVAAADEAAPSNFAPDSTSASAPAVHRSRAAPRGTRLKDLGASTAVEARATDRVDDDAPPALQLGEDLLALDQPWDALLAFEAVAESGRDPAPAFVGMGRAYQALDKPYAAEVQFRRALEADPDYAPARHALAVALAERERPAEAAAEYRRYLALAPEGPHAAHALEALQALEARPL